MIHGDWRETEAQNHKRKADDNYVARAEEEELISWKIENARTSEVEAPEIGRIKAVTPKQLWLKQPEVLNIIEMLERRKEWRC